MPVKACEERCPRSADIFQTTISKLLSSSKTKSNTLYNECYTAKIVLTIMVR